MSQKRFYKFNFNPWKKRINDCAIRAVSAGIGMSYIDVCKAFHVSYRRGYGLIRDTGIELNDIKSTFYDYFGNVADFGDEIPVGMEDVAKEVLKSEINNGIDTDSFGITVNEFIDMFADEGRFLVGCVSPKDEGHIVFVNCQPGKNFLVDTFNSLDFTVDSWMHIRDTVPVTDPIHWKYDKEKRCFIV